VFERLINCIVLFNTVTSAKTTLTAQTDKPTFLFSEKKTPYFPLVSGTRQAREQALRKDNVYIFILILLVIGGLGYPNRNNKA